MKINLNKSTKRALSLVLAFAMLIGSLFTANISVNIKTQAATTPAVWGGASDYDNSWTEIDGEGNYVIRTAGQLYAMVKDNGMVNGTAASFKVADDVKEIYLSDIEALVESGATADTIYAAVAAGNNWNESYSMTWDQTGGFAGEFDGNGVTIYGLYASHANHAGFIAGVDRDYNVVIENVSFKYSYIAHNTINGQRGAVVVASGDGWFTDATSYPEYASPTGFTTTLSNVAVVGAKFATLETDSDREAYLRAALVGTSGATTFSINNCLVADLSGDNVSAFINYLEGAERGGTATIDSCVAINSSATNNATHVTYINCYSTYASDASAITKLANAAAATGEVAKTNMPALDWSGVWFANTGYPELRVFHNVVATDLKYGTHSESCPDCGLTGTISEHYYDIEDEIYNKTYCACGVYIDGLFDIWDSEGAKADAFSEGEGTEEKPYIIKTVEELFLMVRSTGLDENGNAIYYKVDDSVSRLYINDTRGYADQAAFVAAASGLKNWTTGLTTDTDYCGDSSCTGKHVGAYVDYFGGKFDGNGVTIYGLCSRTTNKYWASGSGFVPALTGDATIKNVIFDTNYVSTSGGFVSVITSSFGTYEGQYKGQDENGDWTIPASEAMCPKLWTDLIRPSAANPVIMNVAVRNSYLNTTGFTISGTTYSYASGLVSSVLAPKTIKFNNCLFDGTNSTFNSTATDKTSTTSAICGVYGGYEAKTVFANCANIGDVTLNLSIGYANSEIKIDNNILNSYSKSADEFTFATTPLFNWTAWDSSDDTITEYGVPMPKLSTVWYAEDNRLDVDVYLSNYKLRVLAAEENDYDQYYPNLRFNDEGYEAGVFSDFDSLVGGGTADDPYIISDAVTLYKIIAAGGTNRGIPQYFKLGCDIDLGGLQWVDTQTFENTAYSVMFYQYKPFAGVIDGDGHTVTGMYSARSGENTGFIPELASTGEVRNIHFRDSYAYSYGGSCGIIAGKAEENSVIENCSIEGSVNADYVGSSNGTISNCYIVDTKGVASYTSGNEPTDNLYIGTSGDSAIWYKGGENSVYRLVSLAEAMPYADVDGDGNGFEYTTADLTALKQRLLKTSGYENVYGDVSRNGETNIRDMIILQREVIGDKVNALDGFWRNVRAGNFTIYYDENDNYDFARKLQLYFKEVAGVTVEKVMTKDLPDDKYNIVIKTEGEINDYKVDYVPENAVLTISGGSFTAVEQGVTAFINGSNAVTGGVYTGSGSLSNILNLDNEAYKTAVTVDGQEYHYVWGDEFDTAVNGTVSYDKWLLRNKSTDETPNTADSKFEGLRPATDAEAPNINVVSDGALTLKRGILSTPDSDGYSTYASGISSKNSMLYKQGYAEMLVTLPCDGYAFPSWWLLTHTDSTTNIGMDKSLYGKVYELNDDLGEYSYNGTSNSYLPTDITSYKYKLPTQTLEIDVFEIIQQPTYKWGWNNNGGTYTYTDPSTNNDITATVHKWYPYSISRVDSKPNETVAGDSTFELYDLDWDSIKNGSKTKFDKVLVSATGGTDNKNFDTVETNLLKINTTNLSDGYGQVNSNLTQEGGHSKISYTPTVTNKQVQQLVYGFLWTDDKMSFTIKKVDGTELLNKTVNLSSMGYEGDNVYANDNYGFNQYAYMLIENHWYSGAESSGAWAMATIEECNMTIEYVRLYQLDGERDIVTPETEAFNSNTRW